MFLFVQAMKSHKQPTPSLAFAEHQLLDLSPRQSRSNPPLSSSGSRPSSVARARLSCCGHALESCPAPGTGLDEGWELGLTHRWGSRLAEVAAAASRGSSRGGSGTGPMFWGAGLQAGSVRVVMPAQTPS